MECETWKECFTHVYSSSIVSITGDARLSTPTQKGKTMIELNSKTNWFLTCYIFCFNSS